MLLIANKHPDYFITAVLSLRNKPSKHQRYSKHSLTLVIFETANKHGILPKQMIEHRWTLASVHASLRYEQCDSDNCP